MKIRQEPINAILIGAGNRGADVYGKFALAHPWLFRFTAVVDPNPEKRNRFAQLHGIPSEYSVDTMDRLYDHMESIDAVFICTPDRFHFDQAMAFMNSTSIIVLEKPAGVTLSQIETLELRARDRKNPIIICHVLRYTPFFKTLKRILERKDMGKLININLQENIGFYHFAHSYVRGNWRSTDLAGPSILTKSVHDMDILYWLAGSPPEKIYSMGELSWFKKENAPLGTPERCINGCPVQSECPWYAPNIYLTENTGWPASIISDDPSLPSRLKALETGPYGRCVFRCDNDVADRQSVLIRFANGVGATFSMNALTAEINRTIQIMLTKGEIRGNLKENWLEIHNFSTGEKERIEVSAPSMGHNGGDDGLMYDIADLVQKYRDLDIDEKEAQKNNHRGIEDALEGHRMAFAAEQSRKQGIQISMDSIVKGKFTDNRE